MPRAYQELPLTRRRLGLLLAAPLLAASLPRPILAAETRSASRIVVLDWALAATALALGANVIGVPATDYYRQVAVEPAIPDGTVDIGLLFTPNFELLDELRPDLIVIPPGLAVARPFLSRIAPVASVDLAPDGTASLAAAKAGTLRLGQILGLDGPAHRLIGDMEDMVARAAGQLAFWRSRPILIAMPVDDRHLTLFGPGSLFAEVITALSLTNGLSQGGFWGGRVLAGLEKIAAYPDVTLVLIDPDGDNAVTRAGMKSVFWQALPAARDNRVFRLPPVLENGGIPAAMRLARLLSATLGRGHG